MTNPTHASRADRRRSVFVAFVLPIAFAVALVSVSGDQAVPLLRPGTADATGWLGSLAEPAVEPQSAVVPRRSEGHDPAVVADPTSKREAPPAAAVRSIAVVDAAGRPVPGVMVRVQDAANGSPDWWGRTAGEAGTASMKTSIALNDAATCTVTAQILGRAVTRPLLPANDAGTTVVDVGEVGELHVLVLGATPATTLSVADAGSPLPASWNVARHGGDGASWRIAVATGAQVWLTASERGASASSAATGPGRQGDVVHATVDLRRCVLRGRVTGVAVDQTLRGSWQQQTRRDDFAVAADGTFAVDVARSVASTLTVSDELQFAVCEVPPVDAEEYDVGAVAMAPRSLLGSIVLRDDRGQPLQVAPRLVGALGSDGAPGRAVVIAPGNVQRVPFVAPVGFRVTPESVDVLGAPGIVQATVKFALKGLFFEPASVTVASGVTLRVDCARVARLVVFVDGTADLGLVPLLLRDARSLDTVAAHDRRVDAGGQRHEFREVRPGRHTIEGDGVEIVGAVVELASGDDREVRVTVKPR